MKYTVYDEHNIRFRVSSDGTEFVFGEIRGIPFGFPLAFGESNAIQRIMENTNCIYSEARETYYVIKEKHSSATAPVDFDAYREYLKSDLWKKRRCQALKAGGYFCSMCGSRRDLNVHHLTYAHIGNELPEDLVILCRNCHSKTHGIEEATP